MKNLLLKKLSFLKADSSQLIAKQGFTLIETLVALAIFTTSITVLISITGSGVANTNYAKNKFIASYLAQEGVEMVRNIRDNSWLSGGSWATFVGDISFSLCSTTYGCTIEPKSLSISQCLFPNGCLLNYNYTNTGDGFYTHTLPTGATASPFSRKIIVDSSSFSPNDEVKVTSVVSWSQGSTNPSVIFSENLLNWNQ